MLSHRAPFSSNHSFPVTLCCPPGRPGSTENANFFSNRNKTAPQLSSLARLPRSTSRRGPPRTCPANLARHLASTSSRATAAWSCARTRRGPRSPSASSLTTRPRTSRPSTWSSRASGSLASQKWAGHQVSAYDWSILQIGF